MKYKIADSSVSLCDRCTLGDSLRSENFAKHVCIFCRKDICEQHAKDIEWAWSYRYEGKYCEQCLTFIKTTKGCDLKALGYKAKGENWTDLMSIDEALKLISEKNRAKTIEDHSEFLKSI